MCFHVSQIKKVKDLENRFGVRLSDASMRDIFDLPVYHANGFSHPEMVIIPQEEPSVLCNAIWGIAAQHNKPESLADYYKKAAQFGGGLNAQSEKLVTHFIYKNSAFTRRCLIPVTGFFEPHEFKKKKYPFHIKRTDNDSFALAGLYTLIDHQLTFTILTKAANPYFSAIHNVKKRQPVMVNKENEAQWLKDGLGEKEIFEIIENTYPVNELENYAVGKELFHPGIYSNSETAIERVNFPEFNTLW